MTNRLSVTISTYNRARLLKLVLERLGNQTLSPDFFEIIVCDSNSSDNTADVIAEFKSLNPVIKIRHLHTSNILAKKRNLGLHFASYEVVVFMDDDCIPECCYLEKYFELFNDATTDVESKVYCGEVRFPTEWVSRSNYYRFRDEEGFTKEDIISNGKLDFKTIVVMNMGFLKKSFTSRVGLVNESFHGYGMEDQDLGWRLARSGFSLLMCQALVYHYEQSEDISGYGKKIFHTARDGVTNLLRENLAAVKEISVLRFLDKDYPVSSKCKQILYSIVRSVFFRPEYAIILAKYLSITDGFRFLYSKKLFRFVLACHYVRGANARCAGVPRNVNEWY